MKCYIQWTLAEPQDWVLLDLSIDPQAWRKLPKKSEPVGGEVIDNVPGYPFDFNVQGVHFGGYDHYAARPLAGDGLEVTVWNDDPVDYPPGERYARVWTFLPPAFDTRFGQVNTRQSWVLYGEANVLARIGGPFDIGVMRSWAEFTPPQAVLTRHGVWVTDALAAQHHAVRVLHGWKEWRP